MQAGAYKVGPERVATRAPARGAASNVTPLRARYGPTDIATLLWRRRWAMLLVFLVFLGLGVVVSLPMSKSYTANSSLVVRLGREYVYNPRVGDAGRGAAPANDEVIQSEMEILGSTEVKAAVLRDVGLPKLFPDLARRYEAARSPTGGSAKAQQAVQGEALRRMDTALKVWAAPDTSVVRLSFQHKDPLVAATALNTLVDEYLRYRRAVLLARDVGPLAAQRRDFEVRLAGADKAFTDFLTANGIGDFDSEKQSLAQLYGQLLGDSYAARAQLSETQGRLGVTAAQVSASPSEISLYRDLDHSAADKLATLKVELQDLQGRYRADTQPVKDKQAQVDAMSRLAAAEAGGTASVRRGANPVFQALQTERNTLAAQARSLSARAATLQAELDRVIARRQKLAQIEPQYQALLRDRDLLAGNVKAFAAREQDSQAAQALSAQGGDDTVRVVQRAYAPTKGSSGRAVVIALAGLFGAFAALCLGLVSTFLGRGFPSAASAERTLELPVLAVAPRRAG